MKKQNRLVSLCVVPTEDKSLVLTLLIAAAPEAAS